jgi:hypothetical protein
MGVLWKEKTVASEGVDYAAVIADLESKIQKLQGVVASLKAIASGALDNLSGVLAGGPGGFKSLDNGEAFELPTGALLGKSLPDAIKLYLGAVKKKQTNKQISAALREGGIESTGANFESIVGAIFRLKTSGEVLRFKDGWGLADHYPESLRSRLSDQKPATKKPKKRSTKKTTKTRSKETAQPSAKTAERKGPGKVPEAKATDAKQGAEKTIQDMVLANPTHTFLAAEIAKTVNLKVQVAAMLLGKLARKGIAQKLDSGGYRAAKQPHAH